MGARQERLCSLYCGDVTEAYAYRFRAVSWGILRDGKPVALIFRELSLMVPI
jgi:hypothetical protein